MTASLDDLLPAPASVTASPGEAFRVGVGVRGCGPAGSEPAARVGGQLAAMLARLVGSAVPVRTGPPAPGDVSLSLDGPDRGDETYQLDIGTDSVVLGATTATG